MITEVLTRLINSNCLIPICVVGVSEDLRELIDVVVDIIGRELNTPNLGIKDQLEHVRPLHRDRFVVGIVSVKDPTDPFGCMIP